MECDTAMTLTDKQRRAMIKFFLAAKRLGRSKNDTTAKRYAEEMADAVAEFLAEI